MKETQEFDLTTLVDVPTKDGGVVQKRLLDLTPDDLRALSEQRRDREAKADSHFREKHQRK